MVSVLTRETTDSGIALRTASYRRNGSYVLGLGQNSLGSATPCYAANQERVRQVVPLSRSLR